MHNAKGLVREIKDAIDALSGGVIYPDLINAIDQLAALTSPAKEPPLDDESYRLLMLYGDDETKARYAASPAKGRGGEPTDEEIERLALEHIAPHAKTFAPDKDYKETEQFRRVKAYTLALLGSHSAKVGGDERDAITRAKEILDLVDDYHERPSQATRTKLRIELTDEFSELLAYAAQSADGEDELRLYRWLKDNGRELLTSACEGGWRYTISGEPAPQNWYATADDAIRAAIAANTAGGEA